MAVTVIAVTARVATAPTRRFTSAILSSRPAGPEGLSQPARSLPSVLRSGERLGLQSVELGLGDGSGVEQGLGARHLVGRRGRSGDPLDVLVLGRALLLHRSHL